MAAEPSGRWRSSTRRRSGPTRSPSATAGKVAELDAPGLADAMRELEAISDLAGRAGTYASLAFSIDTVSPEVGALMQQVQERSAKLQTTLLFFDLEWNELDDERAEELLAADEIDFCRHYLRTERRYRPHQLTEPEERILTEMSVTGSAAFARLFTEQTSAITVPLSGVDEPLQLMEALSRLQAPERELRAEAAGAVTEALAPGLRTRAFIYNNMLQDKATRDRLRSFDHWLAARNLDNEASDESVAALIESVVGRYELARRWYRLKARMLGLERLADYDRLAPLAEAERTVPYTEARELVLDCYTSFSPELGATAEEFFTGDYIDAPPAPGQARWGLLLLRGAVGAPVRDAQLHLAARRRADDGARARPRRPCDARPPPRRVRVRHPADRRRDRLDLRRDDRPRPAAGAGARRLRAPGAARLLARRRGRRGLPPGGDEPVRGPGAHASAASPGELSVDDFAAAWTETQTDLLGDSVELSEGYSSWWSYVPHFIATPGYVYAYSYGHLLALSVYSRYEEEGEGFVESYLDLLRAGGSRSPEELGEIVGVDLTDPGFWNAGLDLIERQLERAEQTADAVSD